MSHTVKIYDTCIGCTQCVRACPTDVLEMVPTRSSRTKSSRASSSKSSPKLENLLEDLQETIINMFFFYNFPFVLHFSIQLRE